MKTSSKKLLIGTVAVAAIAAVIVHKKSQKANQPSNEMEKCYGAALAGQNECASKERGHSCSGQSKIDCDRKEWKLVPKGTCRQAKKECGKTASKRFAPTPGKFHGERQQGKTHGELAATEVAQEKASS